MSCRAALRFATLVASILAVPAAFAADPEFCEDYARTAVHQAEVARSTPYCERGVYGPRWSLDYDDHYQWCRAAPYQAARSERQIRHSHLEACRHGPR